MTIRITIKEEKDSVIMAPAGKIDASTADELLDGLEHVKETRKSRIILHLKELEYIDSRGIGALLSFFKGVRDGGGEVRLAETPPKIMELLKVPGVQDLVGIYPTLQEAMEDGREGSSTQEVAQERETAPEDIFSAGTVQAWRKAPYVLAGAGIVVVGILVFLFLRPMQRPPAPESDMGPRLEALERRLVQLENRTGVLSQGEEKVESLFKSLSERLSIMEKELGGLRQEMEAGKKKPEPAAPPRVEQPPEKPPAYHVVLQGETLFRIAQRYGMSVEELQRLNKLKRNQPIVIGQRLLVRPP